VVIAHLRKKAEARLIAVLQERSELATTVVNAFELWYGAYKSKHAEVNLSSVKGFLSTIELLVMDQGIAEKAGEVLAQLERAGRAIDPKDLFIGCMALKEGYAVLTHNREHFQRIPALRVLTPSDLA
jgi:predicted nucleic acid-binding protein